MKLGPLAFLCTCLAACGSSSGPAGQPSSGTSSPTSGSTSSGGSTGTGSAAGASGAASGSGTASGAPTASGTPAGTGSGATSGDTSSGLPGGSGLGGAGTSSGSPGGSGGGTGSTSGAATGSSTGGSGSAAGSTAGSGSASGSSGASTGAAGSGASGSGGGPTCATMIPTGYTGKPFTALPAGHSNTIPGTIHLADYDLGGQGVAFCHTGQPMGMPGEMGCGGFNTGDWRPAGTPQYRPTPAGDTSGKCNGAACDDNAGLCHMNTGEPDDDPTGKPIMPQDVYPCYTATGEWINITVQVMAAGTYSITGLIGAPRPDQNAQPHIRIDFGGGCITTGDVPVPPSICGMPDPGCTEGYHVWQTDSNLATVTFTTPGTYLMTFNLTTSFLNADYFVFTKM